MRGKLDPSPPSARSQRTCPQTKTPDSLFTRAGSKARRWFPPCARRPRQSAAGHKKDLSKRCSGCVVDPQSHQRGRKCCSEQDEFSRQGTHSHGQRGCRPAQTRSAREPLQGHTMQVGLDPRRADAGLGPWTLAESELPALLRGVAMKNLAWWILPIAALASACAGIPKDDGEAPAVERYLAYAGQPVDRFTFPQRIRGWQAVDRWSRTAAGSPRSGHSTWIGCVPTSRPRRGTAASPSGACQSCYLRGILSRLLPEDACHEMEARAPQ